ncbi:MAG TPA: SDR family oxidoreductase [Hyphomicrobiaceae bacterium]|nr:SDR family oxidoreductase [Hyphomicrobiaceae bacterium]
MARAPRTALVTGSGKNIGRASALVLARDGYNVVLNGSRDKLACETVAREVRQLGVDAYVAMGDVGDRIAIGRIIDEALTTFGTIDVLVNNAAVREDGAFLAMSEQAWRRAMAINFDSAYWLSRAFLPGMIAKGFGRIINFAGMNAIHGYNGRAHVSASKHAAWGLTKALAKEFGGRGVTANIISPGPIMGEAQEAHQAAHIEGMRSRVPVGRLGTPDEVAAVVALLASERGAFINGQLIQVNGGAET